MFAPPAPVRGASGVRCLSRLGSGDQRSDEEYRGSSRGLVSEDDALEMWPGLPEVAAGCLWVGGVAVPPPALPARRPPSATVSCLVVGRAVLGSEGQAHLCKEATDGRPDEGADVMTRSCVVQGADRWLSRELSPVAGGQLLRDHRRLCRFSLWNHILGS